MACTSCAEKKAKSKKYEVVTSNGTVVFSSSSRETAKYFAKRYQNPRIEEVSPDGTRKPIRMS